MYSPPVFGIRQPSSAYEMAPKIEKTPPKIQTRKATPTEPESLRIPFKNVLLKEEISLLRCNLTYIWHNENSRTYDYRYQIGNTI